MPSFVTDKEKSKGWGKMPTKFLGEIENVFVCVCSVALQYDREGSEHDRAGFTHSDVSAKTP